MESTLHHMGAQAPGPVGGRSRLRSRRCRPVCAAAGAPEPRTLVFFGDSLTAGYGLADPDTQSYPAQIQRKIDAEHLPWRVVNAGLSGETSAGGLRRIDWVLRQRPDVFVLELGANDGLRGNADRGDPGKPPGDHRPRAFDIPCGPDRPGRDEDAREHGPGLCRRRSARSTRPWPRGTGLALIPFLLDGVAGRPELNQS